MNNLNIENLSCILQADHTHPYELLHNIHLQIKHKEITSFLQFQGTSAVVLMHTLCKDSTTIRLVTPTPFSSQEKELTVIRYLTAKQTNNTGLFSIFSKSSSESKLRKNLYELHSGLENFLQKQLKELSPDESLLLNVLPALIEHPEILLIDTITSLYPEALHSCLFKSLHSICSLTDTTLIFATRSIQLAFHLSNRIFVFNNETLLQEIDNSEKKSDTLKNLFCLYEDNHYISATSIETSQLINQQEI